MAPRLSSPGLNASFTALDLPPKPSLLRLEPSRCLWAKREDGQGTQVASLGAIHLVEQSSAQGCP